jgi:hypothetical protein
VRDDSKIPKRQRVHFDDQASFEELSEMVDGDETVEEDDLFTQLGPRTQKQMVDCAEKAENREDEGVFKPFMFESLKNAPDECTMVHDEKSPIE